MYSTLNFSVVVVIGSAGEQQSAPLSSGSPLQLSRLHTRPPGSRRSTLVSTRKAGDSFLFLFCYFAQILITFTTSIRGAAELAQPARGEGGAVPPAAAAPAHGGPRRPAPSSRSDYLLIFIGDWRLSYSFRELLHDPTLMIIYF